jgi:integrase
MGNPYVFAGRGQAAFNSFSLSKQQLDHKLPKMEGWVLHDLRRTGRSLLARAGVRPDIAERVLGYAIPGVEGVYDRYRYDTEKAEALLALEAKVKAILNPPPANVVPIKRKK